MTEPVAIPRPEAAKLCGLTVGEFDSAVQRGVLPPALPIGSRRKLWHVASLRKALDELAGMDVQSPEAEALARVKKWKSRCATSRGA